MKVDTEIIDINILFLEHKYSFTIIYLFFMGGSKIEITVAKVTLTSEKMFNWRKLRRPYEVKI